MHNVDCNRKQWVRRWGKENKKNGDDNKRKKKAIVL